MELIKLLYPFCLGISCLYSCGAVQKYHRKNWPNILSRNSGEENDNCVCYQRGDPKHLAPSVLYPNNRGVRKLVVYIYAGDQPDDIKMYIPDKKNQQLIPDLPLDTDGQVIPVSNDPIQNIFNGNPNVVNVAKPITKPNEINPSQYDQEYPMLPVDYPVKKLVKPYTPINYPIVPGSNKNTKPHYFVNSGYPSPIESNNDSDEIPLYPTYYPSINGNDNSEIWPMNYQPHQKDNDDNGGIVRPDPLVIYPTSKPNNYNQNVNTRPDLPSLGLYEPEKPEPDIPINGNFYGNDEIPKPGYTMKPKIYPEREYDDVEIPKSNYPLQKEKGWLRPQISLYIPITDNDDFEIPNTDYNIYPGQNDNSNVIRPAFTTEYPSKQPEDADPNSGLEVSVFYPNDVNKKVFKEKKYYPKIPRPYYPNNNNQMPENVPHDIWYDQQKPQPAGIRPISTGEVPVREQPKPQMEDDYGEINNSVTKPLSIKPNDQSPVLAVDLPKALDVGEQKVPVDKFDQWLNEQIQKVSKNGYNTIDLKTLKLLIEKTLAENGMHMTDNGILQDSKGNVLNIQNLKLRPLLIGDAVQTRNIWNNNKNNNEKFQIPKNLPYLEGVLITLVYPPKILGIIPLGVTFLPRRIKVTPGIAMNTKQISRNNIKLNTDNMLTQNDGIVNKDNMPINTDKIMANEEFVMVNNDIKKDDMVGDDNNDDMVNTDVVVPAQENIINGGNILMNKEKINNQDIMSNRGTTMNNDGMMMNNKKNNGVMWPGMSTKIRYIPGKTIKHICLTASCRRRQAILANTKSTLYNLRTVEINPKNYTQNQVENMSTVGKNKVEKVQQKETLPQLTLSDLDKLANFIKAFKEKTLNQSSDDDDPKSNPKKPGIEEKDKVKEKNDESHGFRIIGGNAATSSGTPVSNKGRSGLEE